MRSADFFMTAGVGSTYADGMTARIDFIGIVTDDLPRSLEFYRRLGLEIPEVPADAPHVEAALPGGMRIGWDPVATVHSFDPDWSAPSGGHRVSLAFVCDDPADVDRVYADLVAAGYDGHKEPWDADWGQRYAIVHDPDGNQVSLFAGQE